MLRTGRERVAPATVECYNEKRGEKKKSKSRKKFQWKCTMTMQAGQDVCGSGYLGFKRDFIFIRFFSPSLPFYISKVLGGRSKEISPSSIMQTPNLD